MCILEMLRACLIVSRHSDRIASQKINTQTSEYNTDIYSKLLNGERFVSFYGWRVTLITLEKTIF